MIKIKSFLLVIMGAITLFSTDPLNVFAAPITGNGTSTFISIYNGASTITGFSNFAYNNSTALLTFPNASGSFLTVSKLNVGGADNNFLSAIHVQTAVGGNSIMLHSNGSSTNLMFYDDSHQSPNANISNALSDGGYYNNEKAGDFMIANNHVGGGLDGRIILTLGGGMNFAADTSIIFSTSSLTVHNLLAFISGVATSSIVGDGTVSNIGGSLLVVEKSTNATLKIGSAINAGCIEFGDDDSGGITYITAHRGVLTTTSTRPHNCQ